MQFIETIDVTAPLRVLLKNHQELLGDRMGLTALVRDLKATYPHWQIYVAVDDATVWRNNPHVAGIVLPGEPDPAKIDMAVDVGPFRATQSSKHNGVHFMRAWNYGFIRATGLPVHPGPLKADLHLSAEERAYQPVAGSYWVFNADTNNMGSKRWPAERWRELIRSLPEIRFVQVGLAKDLIEDYSDEPNVTSLVGRTDVRQLFALVAHAEGCVSLISSLMHVAGAFDRPCVVLAGGREPATFEQYPAHYFIQRVGLLPCCRALACWHNSITACTDRVETPAGPNSRCMTTIAPADVRRGIELYYEGGRLENPKSKHQSTGGFETRPYQLRGPRVLRIVTNGKYLGGAERSCLAIARMFRAQDWQVEIATRQPMCAEMAAAFDPVAVRTDRVSAPCDVLLWYASDQVYDAHLPEFELLVNAHARRKVMALTYKLGRVPELPWAKDWDGYLFLSSAMRGSFAAKSKMVNSKSEIINSKCQVLAPPVDLAPFLALPLGSRPGVRIVRHVSQGDAKWPGDTEALIRACPSARFEFMPPPVWLEPMDNLGRFPYGAMPVPQLLAGGNLFLYLLPDEYTDQGPRVVVEAMAAGLPVLCQRRDGCADRVTEETGWFVRTAAEAAEIVNTVTPEILAAKGRAARARAQTEFDPEKWYGAIAGGP
jgi:ADP-heptose:LPS heptosyltransferase